MQYLKYPTKYLRLTQSYNGSKSHLAASTGTPKSYPIDEGGSDEDRDYFYAPCDLTIKRIYGVGNEGTNTVWLQSNAKVKLANGKESYVTIMVIHMNDSSLKDYKVGQTFEQGEKMFLEGKDGEATGYHFHIEVATCKYNDLDNNGWVKNSKDVWVISNNAIKPEDAFYLDNVKVINDKGLEFKTLPKEDVEKEEVPTTTSSLKFKVGDTVLINGSLYKSSNAANASGSVKNKITTITRVAKVAEHPYNTTGDLGWMDEKDVTLYRTNTTLNKGDKVEIIGVGNASSNGNSSKAYGLGYKREILNVWTGRAYPYQVGANGVTTGFYKASALRKL